MTSCDSRDANAAGLDGLLRLAPDPDRAERVRARCRARLGRNRQRSARLAVMTGRAWRLLAPAIVGGFCVLYVVALVATTLHLEGVLR
jgi:hypothetical protein